MGGSTWGATSFAGDVVTGMLRRVYRRHYGRDDRRAGARWFESVHCLYRERTCRPTSRPSTEPPFITNACSRKKSHGLDVNSIYTVKRSFEHCPDVGALGRRGDGALPAGSPPDRWRRSEARWASQITAAARTSQPAPLDFEESSSKFPGRLCHPCARRLTNVPFCRPGDLLFQFIVRKVRRDSGTSGTGSLTDQSVTRRPVYRFHVPELMASF